MNFLDRLAKYVKQNNSLVCVGLDSERSKLPKHLDGPDAIFNFNKAIVDATADIVSSYKLNSAFYEAQGPEGLDQARQTIEYIHDKYDLPIILDAKRADIGNTNNGYVDYAFVYLNADAITLSPYLGSEAIDPFLNQTERGIIVLCRTSNPGSGELQDLLVGDKKLFHVVAEKVRDKWNRNGNCLLVVGATYPQEMKEIRELVGDDMVFLVPGAGAQGGDVEKTVKAGMNSKGEGIIMHSSRAIIFASGDEDFADAARAETIKFNDQVNQARSK
jgi:orotidine-5'-phosphate decarboxylase